MKRVTFTDAGRVAFGREGDDSTLFAASTR